MESRRIAAGAVLLAALIVFVVNSSVSSCVPADSGKCEKVREKVRISWLGGGGKGNATLILAANQNALKENLLEFANIQRKRVSGETDSQVFKTASKVAAKAEPRRLEGMPVRMMTDAELDLAQNKLATSDAAESLNRARRLAALKGERLRRQVQRWIDARLALKPIAKPLTKAIVKTPVKPKKPEALHVPAPAQPGSADPFNAPAPSGQSFHIPPHTTIWYGVSDRGRRLNIWMDADQNSGLVMAIYGADIQDVWNATPTGHGSPGNGHAYFWTGRSRFKGVWRIRITNPNDYSVPYVLTAANISDKNGDFCRDCHGIIEDEWERCEHDGSFCEDLKVDFAN